MSEQTESRPQADRLIDGARLPRGWLPATVPFPCPTWHDVRNKDSRKLARPLGGPSFPDPVATKKAIVSVWIGPAEEGEAISSSSTDGAARRSLLLFLRVVLTLDIDRYRVER